MVLVAINKIFKSQRHKSTLTPPATAEELAQFRIVTNQFGAMAIQQREGTNWLLRANRWQDEKACRWDMEWWIENDIRAKARPPETWTPVK